MKLKAVSYNNDFCLMTEAGDIIEDTEDCKVYCHGMETPPDGYIKCKFEVIANFELIEKIVDADSAIKALPSVTEVIDEER